MSKEELIALLEATKGDLMRYSAGSSDNLPLRAMAVAATFAIWHLKGEPSFVERNNKARAEKDESESYGTI